MRAGGSASGADCTSDKDCVWAPVLPNGRGNCGVAIARKQLAAFYANLSTEELERRRFVDQSADCFEPHTAKCSASRCVL